MGLLPSVVVPLLSRKEWFGKTTDRKLSLQRFLWRQMQITHGFLNIYRHETKGEETSRQGITGDAGLRGSLTMYKTVSGVSAWSDTTATNRILEILGLTQNGDTTKLRLGDEVTQANPTWSPPWATTKYWNGSSWVDPGVVINGNLLVRGEKWIMLNNGNEYIRITGLVRPEDVSSENSVSSQRVANARIHYGGTGDLANTQEQGWLTSFFNGPWWPI